MNFSTYVKQIEKDLGKKIKIFLEIRDTFLKSLLSKYFKKAGIEVMENFDKEIRLKDLNEFLKFVKKEEIQVILIDSEDEEISSWIAQFKKFYPEIKILLILEIKVLEYLYLKKGKLVNFFNSGVDDIIFKPFSLEELQARMLRLLKDYYLMKKITSIVKEDPLTQVFNRRYFEETIREEVYRALRQKYPLTLIMLDLNKFKWYNDNFGHQAGDEVLRKVGKLIKSCVRKGVDKVYRYGGDEFVILLPNIVWEKAIDVINRIFKKWDELKIYPVTIAAGVAQLIPMESLELTVSDLIKRADLAMYEAKKEEINYYKIDPKSSSLKEEKSEKKSENLFEKEINLLIEESQKESEENL